jgi:hypothetical protein
MNMNKRLAKINRQLNADKGISVPKGRRTQSKGGFQSTGVNRSAVKASAADDQISEGLAEFTEDRENDAEDARTAQDDREYDAYLEDSGQAPRFIPAPEGTLFGNWSEEDQEAAITAHYEEERLAFQQKLLDKRFQF